MFILRERHTDFVEFSLMDKKAIDSKLNRDVKFGGFIERPNLPNLTEWQEVLSPNGNPEQNLHICGTEQIHVPEDAGIGDIFERNFYTIEAKRKFKQAERKDRIESLEAWFVPDATGERLGDSVSWECKEPLDPENWLFRCKYTDILRATEKAFQIDLGGNATCWIPKSVVRDFFPGTRRTPSGFLIEYYFAEKDAQSGSPYCKINQLGELI